jgi:hypothetical protein
MERDAMHSFANEIAARNHSTLASLTETRESARQTCPPVHVIIEHVNPEPTK